MLIASSSPLELLSFRAGFNIKLVLDSSNKDFSRLNSFFRFWSSKSWRHNFKFSEISFSGVFFMKHLYISRCSFDVLWRVYNRFWFLMTLWFEQFSRYIRYLGIVFRLVNWGSSLQYLFFRLFSRLRTLELSSHFERRCLSSPITRNRYLAVLLIGNIRAVLKCLLIKESIDSILLRLAKSHLFNHHLLISH